MFAKVNGKDVLWSLSTLRFNNSENIFQACNAAAEVSSLNYNANFTVFHITLYV